MAPALWRGGGAVPESLFWEPAAEDDDWRKDPELPLFRGVSGVVNLPGLAALTALRVLMLLVPMAFWRGVADQTNLYYRQTGPGADAVGVRQWTDTTAQEVVQ
jgi:hypothetical protein